MLNAEAIGTVEMFPIFLKLDSRPCLVVGAGTIAAPKISSLLRAGADVTVIAPRVQPEILELAQTGALHLTQREFTESDLDGTYLVVTATDVQPVNHRVAEAARARNILCNSVDDPPDCDFYYPSVVRRGDLQIAISTAGKSPALSQRLRQEIDAMLPADAGLWLDHLGETRLRLLEALPANQADTNQARKDALHLLARRETCDPAACPVQQTLDRVLPAKSKPEQNAS